MGLASPGPVGTICSLGGSSDWKPISDFGSGVREIRIHVEGAYPVFYVAMFDEGVYGLHASRRRLASRATRSRDWPRTVSRLDRSEETASWQRTAALG